jgi:arsenite-transporting ATPase
MAELMRMDEDSFANLERDKQRYEHALSVLRDKATTVFSLVLIPEKLPIEETHSAITGLARLGIPVQALVINQCILPEVIEGNRFLASRAEVQEQYLKQIAARFGNLTRVRLPLLNRDISELDTLRTVGGLLYKRPSPVHVS